MQDILTNNNLKRHKNFKEATELFNRINNIRIKTIKNEWLSELIYVDSIDGNIFDTKVNVANKIVYQLLNVIKRNGYTIYYNEQHLIYKFIDYWFTITQIVKKGKEYIKLKVNYTNWIDEHDRYNYKFNFSCWEEYMDGWKAETIFDDSDIGYKTRINFPWFVFTQLDLINSPCILKFKKEQNEIDDEMNQLYEEQYGYLNINNITDYSDNNE